MAGSRLAKFDTTWLGSIRQALLDSSCVSCHSIQAAAAWFVLRKIQQQRRATINTDSSSSIWWRHYAASPQLIPFCVAAFVCVHTGQFYCVPRCLGDYAQEEPDDFIYSILHILCPVQRAYGKLIQVYWAISTHQIESNSLCMGISAGEQRIDSHTS